MPHDLVAMAEINTFPVDGDNSGASVNSCFQCFCEKRSHVEIMVPFEINNGRAAIGDFLQPVQYGEIVGKRHVFIADPEFEKITQYKKSIRSAREPFQEVEKYSVVEVLGTS